MSEQKFNLVNDTYGNHSAPMTVSEFKAMCRSCFGEVPEVREYNGNIETLEGEEWVIAMEPVDGEDIALVLWDDGSGWSLEGSGGEILLSSDESTLASAMKAAGVVQTSGKVTKCSNPGGAIYPVRKA